MFKQSCKGSITVEASFVIPIVLGVMVFVIITGFYMHDKCVIFGTLGESASINVMQVRNFGVSEGRYIENNLVSRVKDKTINIDNIDCSDKVDSNNVSAQIKYSSYFDKFLGINLVLSRSGIRNSFAVKFDVSSPEKNIRKTMAINNTLKERSSH